MKIGGRRTPGGIAQAAHQAPRPAAALHGDVIPLMIRMLLCVVFNCIDCCVATHKIVVVCKHTRISCINRFVVAHPFEKNKEAATFVNTRGPNWPLHTHLQPAPHRYIPAENQLQSGS